MRAQSVASRRVVRAVLPKVSSGQAAQLLAITTTIANAGFNFAPSTYLSYNQFKVTFPRALGHQVQAHQGLHPLDGAETDSVLRPCVAPSMQAEMSNYSAALEA